MTFEEVLNATVEMLKRQQRLTYRAIKRQFGLDDDFLEDLKAEIIRGQQVAVDEGGELLVWTGDSKTPPALHREKGNGVGSSRKEPITNQVRSSSQAERRQLTVMFCDLVGFTSLSERLDPEDLLQLVKKYELICAEVIDRFEGNIQQFLGDGLMVYFGHPLAHEDDAQRAVFAALEILDKLPVLNKSLEQDFNVSLKMRIGIHTGGVVVGEMGKADSPEIRALGETPNVASRIQDLADPNSLVISEATHDLVKGFFDTQDLDEYDIKGISRPIKLWRVIRKSGKQTRLEVAGSRLTPLVGRDHEIDLLLNQWARAKGGIGQTVMLKGEPGIGKTRLVAEIKERVKQEDYTCQEYRCSPFYQNTALRPVIHQLEQWLELGQEDSPTGKLRKLEGTLQEYQFKTEAIALLASLLSVPLDHSYTPLGLTPETQRQRTLKVLRALLLERSMHRPLLVVFEDLHWIDPTTLDWLTMVIKQIAKAKVLILLTFRPEFEPPWTKRPNVHTIPLNRLTGVQVGEVAEGVAGGRMLPREVTDQVVQRTDGVPLFIEELTKSLLESGWLRQREYEYELTRSLPAGTIPSTLQDSLMARLDRLSTAKPVAQLGATLGREFHYSHLHAMSNLEELTLQNELMRLEEAELVYRDGLPPNARYSFKHALIQEAAYESLLKGRRREIHQHIAKVLENEFPSTTESEPEVLAYHYTRAMLAGRAIPYWMEAGQRALKRAPANPEAISHLTQGLELLQTLPEGPERDKKELTMQVGLNPAYMITKGWGAKEVEVVSKRAQELSKKLGDGQSLYAATWGLCFNYFLRGQHERLFGNRERGVSGWPMQPITPFFTSVHITPSVTRTITEEISPSRASMRKKVSPFLTLSRKEPLSVCSSCLLPWPCMNSAEAANGCLGNPSRAWRKSKRLSNSLMNSNIPLV